MRLHRRTIALIAAGLAVGLAACGREEVDIPPPRTVPYVDLDRYLGTWYEIARIPNRFQHPCVSDVTAHYGRKGDGRLTVINRCLDSDGRLDDAQGVARVIDVHSNAKLEVSFVEFLGWRPFWGDYWVLALGEDYEYAVVGSPDRRFGWILSRTRSLSSEARSAIDRRLRTLGYDPGRFVETPHSRTP